MTGTASCLQCICLFVDQLPTLRSVFRLLIHCYSHQHGRPHDAQSATPRMSGALNDFSPNRVHSAAYSEVRTLVNDASCIPSWVDVLDSDNMALRPGRDIALRAAEMVASGSSTASWHIYAVDERRLLLWCRLSGSRLQRALD
jgi:hypothetical protein